MTSPYANKSPEQWPAITEALIKLFPLSADVLVEACENAWSELFHSKIGRTGLQIGKDIFLPAQATGVLLERLIATQLHAYDKRWRSGAGKGAKDIIFEDDPTYCFEIKTSSSPNGLYGNRSTGHRAANRKKIRTGYYLVINYRLPTEAEGGGLRLIRFGWIDDEDWTGQAQPTGQQASVSRQVATTKLKSLKSF